MLKLNFPVLVFCLIFILFTEPAQAKMYKCTSSNGKIAFQDKPCKKGAKEELKDFDQQPAGTNASYIIPVMPGAKWKNTESDSYANWKFYIVRKPFKQVAEFYSKPQENKTCSKVVKGNLICKYKPFPGYSYAEVAVNDFNKYVDIQIIKWKK
ncbi:DUF4124 domain-containing protein [Kangiella sp. HZ709]|uniref:DUF4124 domain-containing protein n=1 Tax=Kangiella sp. HZ709 TaxID=2666328 RepID=UPI0012B0E096|nr:DUF4124 domain-containing protein [Kangiella sp. HZ709]MRX27451.1 DUF4124 domain-containing protein [Kangiella sp. HZ709]